MNSECHVFPTARRMDMRAGFRGRDNVTCSSVIMIVVVASNVRLIWFSLAMQATDRALLHNREGLHLTIRRRRGRRNPDHARPCHGWMPCRLQQPGRSCINCSPAPRVDIDRGNIHTKTKPASMRRLIERRPDQALFQFLVLRDRFMIFFTRRRYRKSIKVSG